MIRYENHMLKIKKKTIYEIFVIYIKNNTFLLFYIHVFIFFKQNLRMFKLIFVII